MRSLGLGAGVGAGPCRSRPSPGGPPVDPKSGTRNPKSETLKPYNLDPVNHESMPREPEAMHTSIFNRNPKI